MSTVDKMAIFAGIGLNIIVAGIVILAATKYLA